MIDEQSSPSGHDYAPDCSAIEAGSDSEVKPHMLNGTPALAGYLGTNTP